MGPFRSSRSLHAALTVTLSLTLTACSLAPDYLRPSAPIAPDWPKLPQVDDQVAGRDTAAVTAQAGQGAHEAVPPPVAAADLGWRDMFHDPRLQALIALALENNRDMRIAVDRIEEARALYGIQRADLFPAVGVGAQGTRQRVPREMRAGGSGSPSVTSQYQAGLGLTRFELDLFGRVRNLSEAAREQFLATEEARQSVQINLIGQLAQAYFTLRAAHLQVDLTERTLASRKASYELVKRRFDGGVATELELNQADALVVTAVADLASFTRARAQARNALTLLIGTTMPEDLPASAPFSRDQQVARVAEGLPSALLTRRPDIRAAEAQLRAANASIGAARAAFFPSISLTGLLGSASLPLSGLFDAGSGFWSFSPSITAPLFAGGSLRAGLDLAEARKNIAVSGYESAIQQAFREVADALAGEATYSIQIDALQRREQAARRSLELSDMRYQTGIDNYLQVQIAQVDYFNAQQAAIQADLAALDNRVALYRALGGGWQEHSHSTASDVLDTTDAETVLP